jgi:hypothetical protein
MKELQPPTGEMSAFKFNIRPRLPDSRKPNSVSRTPRRRRIHADAMCPLRLGIRAETRRLMADIFEYFGHIRRHFEAGKGSPFLDFDPLLTGGVECWNKMCAESSYCWTDLCEPYKETHKFWSQLPL